MEPEPPNAAAAGWSAGLGGSWNPAAAPGTWLLALAGSLTALAVVWLVVRLVTVWKMHAALRRAGLDIVPGGNVLQGGGQHYFGSGMDSLKTVYAMSKARNYKPWVVPGGILAPPFVVLSNHADATRLLTRNTHKGHLPSRLYYPGTPKTVVSSEGKEWKRHHDVLAPALAFSGMRNAVPTMDIVAQDAGKYLRELTSAGPQTVDAYDFCSRAVLDVIGHIVYGAGFDAVRDPRCPTLAACHNLSKISGRNFTNPLRRLLFVGRGEYVRNEMVLDVAAKAHLAKNGSTLLTSIRDAKDADGVKVWPSDKAFFEEVRLVVNAAHDPAIPISFALFELATHPDILARVQKEVDAVLGPPGTFDTPLTYETLTSMPLLDAVFKEALRLYPVSGIGSVRMLKAQDTFSGMTLPSGAIAVVPFFTVQRNHNTWERPHEFEPDRFLLGGDRATLNARNKAALLSFSAGPRMCAGIHLATMECLAIMARLIHSVTFSMPKGAKVEMDCGIHLMPKETNITVSQRTST